MKTKSLPLLLFSLICISASSQTIKELSRQKFKSASTNETLTETPAASSWYANARQYIQEQEYHVKWNGELKQHVAVNRKNHLAFYFREDGYRTLSFALPGSDNDIWEYDFRFTGIRRGTEKLATTGSPSVTQSAGHLIYQYPQYAIEYLNDSKGMRQNFIVSKKLPGQGNLELTIQLDGELKATVENSKRLILSSSNNSIAKKQLQYDDLKVWDRNHQLLEARMELSGNGNELFLIVNDQQAAYPITIDPINHTPDWSDNGQGVLPALDVLYGSTVSEAGDVNNDGFDDIIVGAPANINILSGTVVASVGQAFIYFGSASGLSPTPSVTLQSSATVNALFGFSVSNAGDINNDGFDDVIVGAPADNVTLNFGIPFGNLSNTIGKAYVYYGNATASAIPTSVVSINLTVGDFSALTFGLTLNPLFGFSVSNAGDVNNDGYDDVIVGSPVYTDLGTLTLAGRATVYLGSAGGLVTGSPIERNAGLLANSLFGFSVSSAGDMNNDGADEVLIGAPGALSLLPGLTGVAYVYPGIPAPTAGGIASSPVTYTDGALLKVLFGFSVSNAGDINNDGFDDIVVGQPATLSLSGLVTVGKASVFYGSAVLVNKTTDDVSLRSPRDPDILGLVQGNLLFGYSVSGGKDMNCDGISDIIIGEPGGTALTGLTGINAMGGAAYVYFGKNSNGPISAGWQAKETGSLVAANLLGGSVAPAGDVNGDGNQDILVGASNGTLNLSNIITGLINFTLVQSVGSAHVFNGCISTDLFTLPIHLSYFKGAPKNNTVILDWQTTSEINFSHFEIERSINGGQYEKIGSVTTKGETMMDPIYTFTDRHPAGGANTYRLKIIDKDGTFSYSPLVTIQFEKPASIHLRSTIVQSAISIEFNNTAKGLYKVDLFSMNGQLMQSGTVNVTANHAVMPVGVKEGIGKGIYMVMVQQEGNSVRCQEKIIIQ